ncbi:MAG TPA: acyloxyacyl hydrolase [Thermoanaerobaculia bacterium]|nr:acyloxyacyl hydrolase [Thermoanaerobaculia bacterium]
MAKPFMKHSLRKALVRAPLSVLLLCSAPAVAQLLPLGSPEYVSASSGAFEIFNNDPAAYEAGWELRFAPRRFLLLPRWAPDLIPVAGVMAGSRNILYGYAGWRMEIPVGERWVTSGGSAAGIYYRGYSKNLGGALEFRSHVELAYRLPKEARVGICLYHLSNGGIFDFNPGSNSLVLTFAARLRGRQSGPP